MDNKEYIWQSVLDNQYACCVTRIDEFSGQLSVIDKKTDICLYEDTVDLAYGAVFGPDIDDLANWQGKCIDVVDSLQKS